MSCFAQSPPPNPAQGTQIRLPQTVRAFRVVLRRGIRLHMWRDLWFGMSVHVVGRRPWPEIHTPAKKKKSACILLRHYGMTRLLLLCM